MFSHLALALILPLAQPAGPLVAPVADRTSLEKLLAEQAAEARRLEAELTPRVVALLNSLQGLSVAKPGDNRLFQIEDELISLGAPATPLMVGVIDPGTRPSNSSLFLSARIANLLCEMPTTPITGTLIEIATSGTDRGRRNAIVVLGTSKQPERVGKVLSQLFRDDELGLELPALRSLAQLGGPHGQAALKEALSGSTEVTAEALAALAQYGIGDSLPLVRELLASDRSTQHAASLLLYFQSADFEIDSEDTKSLVRLASDPSLKKTVRIAILMALPDMRVDWAKTNAKLLTRTKEDLDSSLAQAALICLARFGHKTEKKDLLKPFKDAIDQDADKPQPLEDRGAIYILLHEYEDALRDFEKAIKVYADSGKNLYSSNKAFIGAARAQILNGDIRAAAKTLEESSLSTLQLRSLGVDPDFAPLVESEKYNEVLRLK